MKKLVFIAIVLSLALTAICAQSFAQIPYYQTTSTYNLGNNVSFKCDVDQYGGVILYNSKNIYTYTDMKYLNGDPLTWAIVNRETPPCVWTYTSYVDILNRVNSALTPAEKQIIGDRKILITIIMNSQTGKVIELHFKFSKRSPYNQLSPSVFGRIEQNFLSRPQIDGFTVTAVGRKLNYVMLGWSHKFK